jgi:hypothetical protein
MSRLILAALIMVSATPAFAGIAHATMSVGVVVLPYDPPAPQPAPQPESSTPTDGH